MVPTHRYMGVGGGACRGGGSGGARVCGAQNGKVTKVLHFVTGTTPNTTRAPVLSSTAGMMMHADDHLSRCCCSCRAARLPLDIYIHTCTYTCIYIYIYNDFSGRPLLPPLNTLPRINQSASAAAQPQ